MHRQDSAQQKGKIVSHKRINLQIESLHFNVKVNYNQPPFQKNHTPLLKHKGILPGIQPLEQVLGILLQILNQLTGKPSQIREDKQAI